MDYFLALNVTMEYMDKLGKAGFPLCKKEGIV